MLTDTTAGHNIRNWQALAMERARYMGSAVHPLFRGEVYMWNGIVMRKMDHSIYFNPGDTTKVITSANRYSATESDQTVNGSLGAGFRVTRSVLLGAQAFAVCEGANDSTGIQAAFKERKFDYESKYEAMGEWMGGEAKLRFKFANEDGTQEPTDHGVVVIDAAVKAVGV
jgi:hypothetical protein